jgi:hypothetical protein
MTNLPEKLRLKAMAEEDMYFARRDRELIGALRQQRLAKHLQLKTNTAKRRAFALEREYVTVTLTHRKQPGRLVQHYRELVSKARKLLRKKMRLQNKRRD